MAGTTEAPKIMPLAKALATILIDSVLRRDGSGMLLVCNDSGQQDVRLVKIDLKISAGSKLLQAETCCIGPIRRKGFLVWRFPHKAYTAGEAARVEAVVTKAQL